MMQLTRFTTPPDFAGSGIRATITRVPATHALGLMVTVVLLAGCASFPPPAYAPAPAGAESTAGKGDHVQAATRYESLAATRSGAEQVNLQLSAVHEWLAANRAAEAARVLGAVNGALTPEQVVDRRLIDAEILLVTNRAQEAWQRIGALAEPAGNILAVRYYELKLRIAFAAGRPVDAVRAEIAAERVAANSTERSELRAQLLVQLREARDRGVRLDPQASDDPVVRGWLELGGLATAARGASLTGAADAARWRARYPNHPANEVLAQAFPVPLPVTIAAARIALLLPLTGRAAGAAGTVRDGFLSAYYLLPAATRPDLRVYDTATLPAAAAVTQARNEGAAFIVGPLIREDVAAVADLGGEPIPVLALNFLPGDRPGPANLYQFALSPEDEARLVARRIVAEGHQRGIALVPAGEWGNRVLAAFTQELAAGGGHLIAQASYDPASHDYGGEIKAALRLNDSYGRLQRLESVLGTKMSMGFEPRRRADVEFIFAPVPSANNARLLAPQLRFYYAGDLPTYTTSDAYEPDSTDSNQDLNGLIYADMPWRVSGDGSVEEIRHTVEAAWGTKTDWRNRLFAFGYDACQLLLAIQSAHRNAADVQVAGLTGQLSIDADRRVRRELLWAQIHDGEPIQIPAAAPAAAP